MTTSVIGRLGGQYSLLAIEDGRYKVQGQTQQTSGVHTLFTGDFEVASRLLDYCQQHDGLAQQAIQDLFYKGDPTMLLQLVEAAKSDPTVKGRKRVALVVSIETDVFEEEDAITLTSQRVSAALRSCGVTVRDLACHYMRQVEPVQPAIGLDYCFKMVEQALLSRVDNVEDAEEVKGTMRKLRREAGFIQSEAQPFDLEEGTGNGQPG